MKTLKNMGFIFVIVLLVSSCSSNIKRPNQSNPPPSATFSEFHRFEMTPLKIAPEFATHPANQKAARKIEEALHSTMDPLLDSWNQKSSAENPKRTLVIEPEVTQIKFIGGAARFWAGALAGNSGVTMKVTYRDKSTGNIIAEPEFYQHANAWGGAYSVGGTDNAMLNRIPQLIVDYTKANYTEVVGGPSGVSE